jgi:hypothetical protein
LMLLRGVFRRVRYQDATPEARAYLKLRQSYVKAGYAVSAQRAPMMFIEQIKKAGAPGSAHAERAVELYLRSRFGAEELDEAARRELHAAAAEARRALRAA